MTIIDTLHRPLRDLRVSVTDRCNFRCPYCMPKEVYGRDWVFLPHSELLSFEEISQLARIFVDLGKPPLLQLGMRGEIAVLLRCNGLVSESESIVIGEILELL